MPGHDPQSSISPDRPCDSPPSTATARAKVAPCPNGEPPMCRNIKTLFNFDPPATDEEIRAASLQFVRKLSGFNRPSKVNEVAFNQALEQVNEAAALLVRSLVTLAPPRDREIEKARAIAASAKRFSKAPVV